MTEPSERMVRSIMMPAPVAVSPMTTVAEAIHLMGERNIGAVVVATDGRVEGVFTERDVLRHGAERRDDWSRTPVSQFMTPNPVTIPPDVPWADAMAVMDQRHIRHLPVVEAGKLVGMLSVRDLLHHRTRFLEALVGERTAELEARNAALTERDEQITRNLSVAARIQSRLLPEDPPVFPPFRFAIAFHPHDQVTGDYYDFIQLGPDFLGILIADAAGHGVPAAFVSLMAKMCCKAYCHGLDSPAAILKTMNTHLSGLIEGEQFITMFAAAVNRRSSQLTYSRAGHPLPLVFCAGSGEVTSLDAPGLMIGVLPDPGFEDQRLLLRPGDKVLFYTDGVPECRNPAGILFGVDALESFLRREGHRTCHELLAALEQELQQFRCGRPFDDDVTIIVLELNGKG